MDLSVVSRETVQVEKGKKRNASMRQTKRERQKWMGKSNIKKRETLKREGW